MAAAATKEFVAAMVGLPRATIAEGLGGLERAGLVGHRGGVVEVLDGAGLQRAACDCYGAVRGAYEQLLAGAPGSRHGPPAPGAP